MGIHQALILIDTYGQNPVPPPVQPYLELTSGLYPVIVDETVTARASLQSATLVIFFQIEEVYARAALQSGVLDTIVKNYTDWPIEEVYARASLQSGVLTVTIAYQNYTNWPIEDVYARASLQSGVLTVTINYITNDIPPENLYARASLQSATLV